MNLNPTPAAQSPQTGQDSDAAELQKFGYVQELKRTMGGFSSFAIAFSLISITTGISAGLSQGLRQAGPAVVWSWCIVVVGQTLVALVLAELSTRFPISGYGYQWTSRLMNPHYGYFVGWLLLLQFLTGFPGVCKAVAENAAPYAEAILGGALGHEILVRALTIAVISLIALTHIFGIKIASLINDAGVVTELAGAATITVALIFMYGFGREDGYAILFNRTNFETQSPAGISAFALSMIMGAWCLTGFEAAADMAEETLHPRKTVPRAILVSLLSSGIGGFFMLAGLMFGIENLSAVQASDNPIMAILQAKFGAQLTNGAVLVFSISIFACGVASLAGTTRLIFSLARDNMLPYSSVLREVHPEHKTPTRAIISVWVIASALVAALPKLDVITSISAVAGYLGYGAIILASLFTRHRTDGITGGFELGPCRRPIGWSALVWTILLVGALTIPSLDGGHLPALATLGAILLGVGLYFAVIRRRILRGEAGPPQS
ncbi:amino acid permease [Candidatus Sumerlaeota bacterium]|nr:amino acid permease [Candidatus Sumerlaeota bacterium]